MVKNFDAVNKFDAEVGNGVVLCLTKNITALNDNDYLVPIEYI